MISPLSDNTEGPKRIRLSRARGWCLPENTVIVSRPQPLGNPFRVYEHCKGPGGDWGVTDTGRLHQEMGHGWTHAGAARTAVALYARTLDEVYPPGSTARWVLLNNLRGRNLACWCPADLPCHADHLLTLANHPTPEEPK